VFGTTFELYKRMKYLVLAVIICSLNIAFSQNTITITSEKLPVVVMANDVLQNEVPSKTIHLSNIPDGSISIKIISIDSLLFTEKNVFTTNDEHPHFEFSVKNKAAFVRLIGEYRDSIPQEHLTSLNLSYNNSFAKLLELTKNETFVTSLNEFASYQGKKGCDKPQRINKFDLMQHVESAYLTRQKTSIILNALDEKCISTSDMKEILLWIDFEDVRLSMISQLQAQIFDIDNLSLLDELFTIKQNQEQFNTLKNEWK
jgi:hypothetical protein